MLINTAVLSNTMASVEPCVVNSLCNVHMVVIYITGLYCCENPSFFIFSKNLGFNSFLPTKKTIQSYMIIVQNSVIKSNIINKG